METEHNDKPYCKNCYGKHYGPKGMLAMISLQNVFLPLKRLTKTNSHCFYIRICVLDPTFYRSLIEKGIRLKQVSVTFTVTLM